MKIYTKSDKYGWWVAPSPKPTTSRLGFANKSDFSVKFCTVCETGWEKERAGQAHSKIKVLHYTDFPKNGLKRKVCIDCKRKYNKNKEKVK